jgi:hypothetical protein
MYIVRRYKEVKDDGRSLSILVELLHTTALFIFLLPNARIGDSGC